MVRYHSLILEDLTVQFSRLLLSCKNCAPGSFVRQTTCGVPVIYTEYVLLFKQTYPIHLEINMNVRHGAQARKSEKLPRVVTGIKTKIRRTTSDIPVVVSKDSKL